MMHSTKHSLDEILQAIDGSMGIKAVVARRLHCDWKTVHNYSKRYVSVAHALFYERQELVDLAESQLAGQVAEGDRPKSATSSSASARIGATPSGTNSR